MLTAETVEDFLGLFINSSVKLLFKQVSNCIYWNHNALVHQNVKARSEDDFECIINHIIVDWIEDKDYFLDGSNRWSENAYIL